MNPAPRPLAAALLGLALAACAAPAAPPAVGVQRIAFGSCSDEDDPQPLWAPILESRPDLWVWLGDNVYGDTEDMSVLRAKYQLQLEQPGYAVLRERVPVIGTWDDHDYGVNNGGEEYPRRAESQQLLLDFLGVPRESPLRAREGAYSSHTYGEPGRQVKVILLDTRYHRDPIGSGGTILGEAQWAWLEEELRRSTAQVHLIGSSIQVLPQDHPYERWDNFPAERDRLFRLIAETRAPGVVLLSGDRHLAEISRVEDPRVGYPIYEVTSSGMTHSFENAREPNRHRVGELVTVLNWGMVEIDWQASPVELRLQVRDGDNQVRAEERVSLSRLQPRAG